METRLKQSIKAYEIAIEVEDIAGQIEFDMNSPNYRRFCECIQKLYNLWTGRENELIIKYCSQSF